jgi:leader peptidase (prepilin peptidase)/N-methyltransferase
MIGLLLGTLCIGLAVGSFLNVCIVRLPAGQSIVSPPSHCPQCGAPIRPRDNIPLLSYLLLGGRCRDCEARISVRYPLVEALAGVLFAATAYWMGPVPQMLLYWAFLSALIVITFVDLDHQIIPDAISIPGIAVGVLAAVLGYGPSWHDSVIGALVGGGILYAVAVGYHALTKREGMGGGDIKLLAMIGAFLGWRGVLVTLVFGSLTGSVIGMAVIALRGGDSRVPIPFGPFLALGAAVALFVGEPLLDWYLRLI